VPNGNPLNEVVLPAKAASSKPVIGGGTAVGTITPPPASQFKDQVVVAVDTSKPGTAVPEGFLGTVRDGAGGNPHTPACARLGGK
jgi:hypothetical protein